MAQNNHNNTEIRGQVKTLPDKPLHSHNLQGMEITLTSTLYSSSYKIYVHHLAKLIS